MRIIYNLEIELDNGGHSYYEISLSKQEVAGVVIVW